MQPVEVTTVSNGIIAAVSACTPLMRVDCL